LELKNKYGHVSLQVESNIIISNFNGSINESLVLDFSKAILSQAKIFAGSPWAYISNSLSVQAATPGAEERFICLTKDMVKKGCVASAYILDSTVAINQMQRVLNRAGLYHNIHDLLFTNMEEALSFVEQKMKGPVTSS